MLFLKAGDYKKTLEIARTIVSRSPNSAAALGILGIVHFGTAISPCIHFEHIAEKHGHFASAMSAFEKALELSLNSIMFSLIHTRANFKLT